MALDPVIKGFREEFDRFWGLMEQQIEVCPDEIWNRKESGWVFWQQHYHTAACVELFALPEGRPSAIKLEREVWMLVKEPQSAVSKQEMLDLFKAMRALAYEYMEASNTANLAEVDPVLSKRFGREVTRLFALMGLIRHCCYHLGCCDSIFRNNGMKGVY
ncbi:MAG: DinB family protein [Deltaproteobacteria bacterium]|jgi:hypothetical protein|nr:DinB family protein [Deltaproteobacteria bacterium]